MSIYTIALFAHVSGAIGFSTGIGVWLLALIALRRAQRVEQVRTVTGLIELSDRVTVIGVLLAIASGLYMALATWGLGTGWIAVALGSLPLMPLISVGVLEPRLRTIAAMASAAPDGPLPESLTARIHDSVIGTAAHTLAALLFGIEFLMTTKPPLASALLVMVVALALGLASGWPLRRARYPRRQAAGDQPVKNE